MRRGSDGGVKGKGEVGREDSEGGSKWWDSKGRQRKLEKWLEMNDGWVVRGSRRTVGGYGKG